MKETYIIHITKKCNANCYYCYELDKSSLYSFCDIKPYIDYIIDNDKNSFNIEFIGGEPTLNLDLINEIYNYTSIKRSDIDFYLTTNGTILSDKLFKLLENSNFFISISIDGKPMSNSMRILNTQHNTHDIVLSNIIDLQQKNINVKVHMVVHPYNVGWLYENFEYFCKLNIKLFTIGIIESTIPIDKVFCNRFLYEMDKIINDIINFKFKNVKINLLEQFTSLTDNKKCIFDNNKLILESYGRSIVLNNPKEISVSETVSDNESKLLRNYLYELVYLKYQLRLFEINCDYVEYDTDKLLIVFAGYNIKEYLEDAITSFLIFHPNLKKNIIVFDDNSTDGTFDWLKMNNIKRITWSKYRPDPNISIKLYCGYIYDDIISQIDSDYLLILDGDTITINPFVGLYFDKYILNGTEVISGLVSGKILDQSIKHDYSIICDENKFFRITPWHLLLDLKKLKQKNIIFDRIQNKEWLDIGPYFEFGADFTKQVLDNDIKLSTVNDEFVVYHYGFVSGEKRINLNCDWILSYRKDNDEIYKNNKQLHQIKHLLEMASI